MKPKKTNRSKSKLTTILLWILTRSLTLGIGLYLFSLLIVDYKKINTASKIRSLEYQKPISFKYFIDFINDAASFNQEKWQEYSFYYEKLVEYSKENSAAYQLLGYCYLQLDQKDQAINAFQKAQSLQPDLFWPYYNLGIIAYKSTDYSLAFYFLKNAVGKNPKKTLIYQEKNEFFIPLFKQNKMNSDDLSKRLKQAYQKAYVLIIQSNYHLKNYEEMLRAAKYGLNANIGNEGLFYFYAGVAAYYLVDYTAAINFFQKAQENDFKNNEMQLFINASKEKNSHNLALTLEQAYPQLF